MAGQIAFKLDPEAFKNAKISVYENADMEVEYFLLSFIKVIERVPITAFQRCPGCDGWIIRLTKRPKQYCENRCASRSGQKKQRDELKRRADSGDKEAIKQRDIVLQKSRKRSSDNYHKKVKEEHPGAKIQKRPWRSNQA